MSIRRENVDFRIADEPWNRYKLSDDTVLKIRVIMTDVRVVIVDVGKKNYNSNFKYHIGHIIPQKNFVEPEPRKSVDEIKSQENLVIISFDRVSEKTSEYELDDGTILKAKLVFKTVKKSRFVFDDGTPYYFISDANVWNKIESPKQE